MPDRTDAFVMVVPAIPAHAVSPQSTPKRGAYFAFGELVLFCEMLRVLLQSPTRHTTFRATKVLMESDWMRVHSEPNDSPLCEWITITVEISPFHKESQVEVTGVLFVPCGLLVR